MNKILFLVLVTAFTAYGGNDLDVHAVVDKYFKSPLPSDGWSPLHKQVIAGCCDKNFSDQLKALVDTQSSTNGMTPLHVAGLKGRYTAFYGVFTHLIEIRNANVDLKDNMGFAVVHYAAHQNDEEMINLLAKHGADMNAEGIHGIRPLHIAAAFGNEKALNALLQRGADLSVFSRGWGGQFGRPLDLVKRNKNADVSKTVQILEEAERSLEHKTKK